MPAITGNDALAKTCGLLVASEPAERGKFGVEPITHRDPQLDSQWVLDQGGDANKYFAQLRVDRPAPKAGEPDLATLCLDAVREVVADCAAVGIPSVIENLVYPLEGEDFTGKRREDAIIEAARALNEIDCDLLKLEYPGSPEGCRRLAEILDRPWAVLSAGVPFDEFTQVLEVAFDEGGASGFIAGRSVWRESLALEGAERAVVPDRGRTAPAGAAHQRRDRPGPALDRVRLTARGPRTVSLLPTAIRGWAGEGSTRHGRLVNAAVADCRSDLTQER